MEMRKYRARPVIKEAWQFTWENCNYLPYAIRDDDRIDLWIDRNTGDLRGTIKTLEGPMAISEGDYIVRGLLGEFYPCHPEAFERQYEPI